MLTKVLIFAVLLVNFQIVKCNERPETSIKNMTEIDKAKPKPKNGNEDPFKKDLRKYLRECGADVSGEDDDEGDDDGNQRGDAESAEEVIPKGKQPNPGQQNANWAYENKRKGGNKGTYPSHYGKKKGGNRSVEDSDEEDDDDDDYRGSSNNNRRKGGGSGGGNNNNRRNNRNKGNRKPSNDYDDSRGENCDDDDRRGGSGGQGHGGGGGGHKNQWGGGSSSGSGWSNRGSGGGSGSRYNSNRNSGSGYSGYSNNDPYGQKTDFAGMYGGSNPTDMWGSRGGMVYYGGRLMAINTAAQATELRRSTRQTKNDGEQCLSQCVFGYLEMLDDNRVPAETEVIKYFQGKIINNLEKTRLIKLTRRCFAKLSTAEIPDNEDGCQFSKDLARCLQIQIKNENN